jgi:hypothetical protein
LIVSVAEPDASKPARVNYTIVITGNDPLEVEPPESLGSPRVWNWSPDAPILFHDGNTPVLIYSVDLDQVKPGLVPLPGVRLAFHTIGKNDWDAFEWTDILKESRELELAAGKGPDTPPPGHSLLWLILGPVAVVIVVLVGVALWVLRRPKPVSPLTPQERALRQLDLVEGLGRAGPDESGRYPAEVSEVVRGFLAERYGLPAQQQTTAEFLRTMAQTAELSEEQRQALKELLERCDLAKFAAARTPPDECRRLAALARSVIKMSEPPVEAASRAAS